MLDTQQQTREINYAPAIALAELCSTRNVRPAGHRSGYQSFRALVQPNFDRRTSRFSRRLLESPRYRFLASSFRAIRNDLLAASRLQIKLRATTPLSSSPSSYLSRPRPATSDPPGEPFRAWFRCANCGGLPDTGTEGVSERGQNVGTSGMRGQRLSSWKQMINTAISSPSFGRHIAKRAPSLPPLPHICMPPTRGGAGDAIPPWREMPALFCSFPLALSISLRPTNNQDGDAGRPCCPQWRDRHSYHASAAKRRGGRLRPGRSRKMIYCLKSG